MKKLIILGTGGFAREVVWLIREMNAASSLPLFKILGFVGPDQEHEFPSSFAGPPVLGDDDWVFEHLSASDAYIVGAIGNPAIRRQVVEKYALRGFKSAALVHPSVSKSDSVRIGQGCIICAGARLTVQVNLGQHVIVNLNATVGHDNILGDFTTIHPGANLSGNCQLGRGVEVGTGAALLPGTRVGDGAIIGAGAVVNSPLEAGKTYVGVPARALIR
ncbi:MAG: acetyltransferase [Bacteroidia bacterium]|nr:acetyltransferase [Bacteroidia bacterium]